MNKIIYDINVDNKFESINYRNSIKKTKGKKDFIKLCLYCAKYCFAFNDEKSKLPARKCIDLIEKWLIKPNEVTKKELTNNYNDYFYANVELFNNYAYKCAAHIAFFLDYNFFHFYYADHYAITYCS